MTHPPHPGNYDDIRQLSGPVSVTLKSPSAWFPRLCIQTVLLTGPTYHLNAHVHVNQVIEYAADMQVYPGRPHIPPYCLPPLAWCGLPLIPGWSVPLSTSWRPLQDPLSAQG
jgi:hypothetical protein